MRITASCCAFLPLLCGLAPNQDWLQEAKILPGDPAPFNEFGSSVAVDGDTAFVGVPLSNHGGLDAGSVYVFVRSGYIWTQLERLNAFDPAAHDHFGQSVAIRGDVAVIGAPGDDDGGVESGGVYVFTRQGGSWFEQAKLSARDATAGDELGASISLGDGRILAGAPGKAGRQGAAYVFVDQGTSWAQEGRLTASAPEAGDDFGNSVSIDGDLALVGAFRDGGTADSGSAYVFERFGSSWILVARLTAGDAASGDLFGSSVSVRGDRALVGAPRGGSPGLDSGAAYVFLQTGSLWREEKKLTGSLSSPGGEFGCAVSLHGNVALVGARLEVVSWSFGKAGVAYFFQRTDHRWIEQTWVIASDPAPGDLFGASVSLHDELALIGSPGDYSTDDRGAAYAFSVLGSGFCFGDPGSGTPCPCGNDNDGSIPGSGCDNGTFASGARLSGSGKPSVADDSLVLTATNVEPNNTGMYFQAQNDLSPGVPWGDGLRCVGGDEIRLEICVASIGGVSKTTISLGATGGAAPGETRYYQLWYRTIVFPPCGYGVNNFNTTNGYAVTWRP